MPIITDPVEFNEENLYVDLLPVVGERLLLKCEGFNFAGSVKLKAAAEMVRTAERDGTLRPGATLIESSSGNFGIALSVIAANRGYRFVCVTDTRCNRTARRLMESLGTEVHMVTEPDPVTGFLGARLSHVRDRCAADESVVWLNQYVNPANWMAHYQRTGPAIAQAFPDLGVLFVGSGTTGTLMGCARYLRDAGIGATVVAVDAAGSAIFGEPLGRRLIPGLGLPFAPSLLDMSYVDDVVHVPEEETIEECRRLAGHGFLLGGSTGAVVRGAIRWLQQHGGIGDRPAVAIAPDLGERYLDTVFDHDWAETGYGAAVNRPVRR